MLHRVTAFGGERGSPFQQAIPQSPYFQLVSGNVEQKETYEVFLKAADVSTVEEARDLTTKQLQAVNTLMVAESPYGLFTFCKWQIPCRIFSLVSNLKPGPVVDGSFVPGLPGNLLSSGDFDQSLSLLIGHNATSPYIRTQTLSQPLPLHYSPMPVYQPSPTLPASSTLQSSTAVTRTRRSITAPRCSMPSSLSPVIQIFSPGRIITKRTIIFSMCPPAYHGLDVAYTFYDDHGVSSLVRAPNVALGLQSYITEFVQSANPNGGGTPYFPVYGTNSSVMDLGVTEFGSVTDPTANERCTFWQKALYF